MPAQRQSDDQRRAMFARMGAGHAGPRRFAFPLHGRGGTAERNRTILYSGGAAIAAAGLIASRKFVPRSVLSARGLIATSTRSGEILRAGRGDVVRIKMALRRQAAELRGLHRGLRTQSEHYPLDRAEAAYQHEPGKLANRYAAFVYDRPARGGALWPGEQEREFLENPLTGGLARRLIGGEEGKVIGVPPLTRYMMDAKRKYSIARLRENVARRLEGMKLRGERFEGALDDLEEGTVRNVRRRVQAGVRRFTEPRPPKDVLRGMKQKIRREEPQTLREIRRAILTERGVLFPEGGIGVGQVFRHSKEGRRTLREAFAEARRANDRYLTREALNRLSKDYPSLADRIANRVVSPVERVVNRVDQFANEQMIRLGRRLGFPVDDAIAERLKKAGVNP